MGMVKLGVEDQLNSIKNSIAKMKELEPYSKSLYDRPNLNGVVIAKTGTEEWRSPSPKSQMGRLTKNLCQLLKK